MRSGMKWFARVCCVAAPAMSTAGCATSSHKTVHTYDYSDEGRPARQQQPAEREQPGSDNQMVQPGEMVAPGEMVPPGEPVVEPRR